MNSIKSVKSKSFQCDCHGRDHIIVGDYFIWKKTDTNEYIDDEILLSFKMTYGDWIAEYHSSENYYCNKFVNWVRRIGWRLKIAIIILFKGYIELEDSWIPLRNNSSDNEFYGIDELQNFIDWLQEALNASKENHNK